MAVYVSDLLRLKNFSETKLIAGRQGLGNHISWPYVCVSFPISPWIRGGELLFVAVEHVEETDLTNSVFWQECRDMQVAAVVALLKDGNEDKLLREAGFMADSAGIPLFVMPWDVSLVSVTQEVTYLIIDRNTADEKSRHFLENLLFSPTGQSGSVEEIAQFYGITVFPVHFICIFGVHAQTQNTEIDRVMMQVLRHAVNDLNPSCWGSFLTMEYANNLLVLVFNRTEEEAKEAKEAIADVFRSISSRYLDTELYLGFSRIHKSHDEIKMSYNEAMKTIFMLRFNHYPSNILHYRNLGIVKLLFELNDTRELEAYCEENIGCIIEYDKKYSTDLLMTLKGYLMNGQNLVKTSSALYIHRNTLVYRLSIMKKLLGHNMDDAVTMLELFNCILIYEFLQSINHEPKN